MKEEPFTLDELPNTRSRKPAAPDKHWVTMKLRDSQGYHHEMVSGFLTEAELKTFWGDLAKITIIKWAKESERKRRKASKK